MFGRRFATVVTSLLLLACGCMQQEPTASTRIPDKPKQKTAANSSAEPALEQYTGNWTANEYSNDVFGLSIRVPRTWTLQKTDFDEFLAMSLNATAGNDAKMRREFQAAEERSVMIFKASVHAPGSPGPNANIIASVEQLSHMPEIKNGYDYLRFVDESQEGAKIQSHFIGKPTSVRLGDALFFKWEYEMNVGAVAVNGVIYARVIDRVVLLITSSYLTEEYRQLVKDTLRERRPA